jgi:hypothetical protein
MFSEEESAFRRRRELVGRLERGASDRSLRGPGRLLPLSLAFGRVSKRVCRAYSWARLFGPLFRFRET